MMRYLRNVSLQMRLAVLTMIFVIGISGVLLLLTNRNTAIQMTAVARPLEEIYISTTTSLPSSQNIENSNPKVPQNTDTILITPIEQSVPISASSTTEAKSSDTIAFSKIVKAQEASFVLNSTAANIKQYSYYSFAILVLIAGLGVYFWCGRVLKPVRILSEEMHKRTVNNLNQPIQNENAVAEMKQLSDAFNHMICNLNQAFEIQKQFNANAAHELRTPIAVLQANLEVIAEEENPDLEDYKNFMDITQRTISRMSSLVENLLQMTKLEDIKKDDFIDLKYLLTKAVEEVKGTADLKQVCVQTNFTTQDSYLKGNETLLFTAIYNLIENAVKYNQQKGSVCIGLAVDETAALITVSDTGIGIAKEELEAIFQPFYRVDKSRARGLGGAGMGLHLVRNIVQCHGGDIIVNSEIGMGSNFQIRIPLWIRCLDK